MKTYTSIEEITENNITYKVITNYKFIRNSHETKIVSIQKIMLSSTTTENDITVIRSYHEYSEKLTQEKFIINENFKYFINYNFNYSTNVMTITESYIADYKLNKNRYNYVSKDEFFKYLRASKFEALRENI